MLPRRFGRYTLFDFIGKGGMAEIFLSRASTELGGARLCVVKEILPELAQRAEFAEMLIHEAKLAARLNHANVVQVFDLGRADEQLFIAMDYVEGFDLNQLLRHCSRAKVPLPPEFALLLVSEALKGLDYAHRRTDDEGRFLGIVHRDVSPSNILISFEGEVKLCDFGIARANDTMALSSTDLDERIKGKAGYMSPEQARGEPLDARADVFAIGIVLWELLAGHRLYRVGDGRPSLIEQAAAADIPRLLDRGLANHAELQTLVDRALARDRDARFASAALLLRSVDDYVRSARFVTSSIAFGDWLVEHFGSDIVAQRRSRERAARALDAGPPIELDPLTPAPLTAEPAVEAMPPTLRSTTPPPAPSSHGTPPPPPSSAGTPRPPPLPPRPPRTPAPAPVRDVAPPSSTVATSFDVTPQSFTLQTSVARPRARSPLLWFGIALVVAALAFVVVVLVRR